MRNPDLFSRVFNTPLMIHPAKLDAIIAGLAPRWNIDLAAIAGFMPQPNMALIAQGERKRGGYEVIDGVAVIEIFGVLAHRGGIQADSSYILGYETIGQMLAAALADESAHSILLVLDSPGGEAAGAFELAQQIRAANAIKPVSAAISNLAASAGYQLASACSQIAISQTASAGSIGVVLRHVDMSSMLKDEGLDVTYIYAGERKIDGNPHQPLSDEARARFQAHVDKTYALFTETVAAFRGLKVSDVVAQQAAMYTGQEAIDNGLADVLATPDELLEIIRQNHNQARYIPMNEAKTQAASPEKLDAIRAEGFEAGKQHGMAEGAQAERARITAILTSEHAAGRESTAQALALETDMTAEAAAKVLSLTPKAEQAAANPFAVAMAGVKNPNINPGGGEEADERQQAAKVVSLWDRKLKGE